jgi:D-serine deaminase-like pyridoxal phosphate-dependent protein
MDFDWNQRYLMYRKIIRGQRLPLAFVDLDAFDHNIDYVAVSQKETGKTVRVASKSIRCLALIRRVFEQGGAAYQGVLAFSVEEAAYLIDHGIDDIIVAYPTVQPSDLELIVKKTPAAKFLAVMVDCLEHLEILSAAGEKAGLVLNACLDIDMSYRPLGQKTHIGVRRSPIRTARQALALAQKASKLKGVKLNAVMGYEAQVAGVNDDVPGRNLKNRLIGFIKRRSMKELKRRRARVLAAFKKKGIPLEIVNGGGSGSLVSTGTDNSVTEIAAGSAFFAPGLFRHYREVTFQPAAFFALQVTRKPAGGIITCAGGGYVASGETGRNKLPWPVMPDGLKYIAIEGAGEVQTPLILPKDSPKLEFGDPVFFQHAKAGELCERFNELLLVRDGKIVGRVKTYRGEGKAFL